MGIHEHWSGLTHKPCFNLWTWICPVAVELLMDSGERQSCASPAGLWTRHICTAPPGTWGLYFKTWLSSFCFSSVLLWWEYGYFPTRKLKKCSNVLKCNHSNSGRHWPVFQIKMLWILCSFKVKDHKAGHHWKERSRTKTTIKIQETKLTSKASPRHGGSSSTDLLCNILNEKMCTLFLPLHIKSLAPPARNEKTAELLHGEAIKMGVMVLRWCISLTHFSDHRKKKSVCNTKLKTVNQKCKQ